MNQRGPIIVEQVNEQPDPDVVAGPLYFHHHDLVQNLDAKKTVSQRKLINLWNNIHFMDGTVQVHLRHYHNNKEILVEAYPVPCSDQSPSGDLTTRMSSFFGFILRQPVH